MNYFKEKNLEWENLWTNPDINSGNSFVPQTISIPNIREYKLVQIIFSWSTASLYTREIVTVDPKYLSALQCSMVYQFNIASRGFQLQSTGVKFNACCSYNIDTKTVSTNDNYTMLPFEIRGLKEV